jgi:restriction system protein
MGRRTGYGPSSFKRRRKGEAQAREATPGEAAGWGVFLLLLGLFFDATRWISITVLTLVVLGAGWYLYWKFKKQEEERVRQVQVQAQRDAEFGQAVGTLEGNILATIDQHRTTLARKHRQLLQPDEYGVTNTARWDKEFDRFVQTVLFPALNAGERRVFEEKAGRYRKFTRDQIAEAAAKFAAEQARQVRASNFRTDLTPLDFEHWCADTLRGRGWNARPTPASGDQGADVIAERFDHRVVIQCKLYSKPVGNKAVQEVHSAKTYYGATSAVVVSNAGFTPSARALAASTGVLLLDQMELAELNTRVRRP